MCQQCFMTDDLQFGFKQNMSCSGVIFAVHSAVNYHVERGSCVYAVNLTALTEILLFVTTYLLSWCI